MVGVGRMDLAHEAVAELHDEAVDLCGGARPLGGEVGHDGEEDAERRDDDAPLERELAVLAGGEALEHRVERAKVAVLHVDVVQHRERHDVHRRDDAPRYHVDGVRRELVHGALALEGLSHRDARDEQRDDAEELVHEQHDLDPQELAARGDEGARPVLGHLDGQQSRHAEAEPLTAVGRVQPEDRHRHECQQDAVVLDRPHVVRLRARGSVEAQR